MYKFGGNRGKFINFVEIGEICNMHHFLIGKDTPVDNGLNWGVPDDFVLEVMILKCQVTMAKSIIL